MPTPFRSFCTTSTPVACRPHTEPIFPRLVPLPAYRLGALVALDFLARFFSILAFRALLLVTIFTVALLGLRQCSRT